MLNLMKKKKCSCKYLMVVSNMYNCHLGLELLDIGVSSYLKRETLTPDVFLNEVAETLRGNGGIKNQIQMLVEKDGEASCDIT